MRYSISIRLAFSAILLGAPFSGVSEDLDAALEAKKKKARRHVYSERALIENRDILIPKTLSEEEKALDRDLERLENQLDRQIIPPRGMAAPRVFSPAPATPKNWLTPTLLDTENEDPLLSEESETSWIGQELARQKSIQLHEKELAEEEALVNKLLREESRNDYSTETSPARAYESIFQTQITPGGTPSTPGYRSFNPLGTPQSKENIGSSKPLPLFSPPVRSDSGIIKPSFSSAPSSSSSPRTPSWHPAFGSPAQKPISDFTSRWKTKSPAPLPPLKRVRQSSPIRRKDPFTDDFMHEIKTSIWD